MSGNMRRELKRPKAGAISSRSDVPREAKGRPSKGGKASEGGSHASRHMATGRGTPASGGHLV